MEQKLRNTMKSIQQQMEYPEHVDIRTILNKKKPFPAKRLSFVLAAAAIIFLVLDTGVTSSLASLFGTTTEPPHPYQTYLVHNAYYYIPTDKKVDKDQLEAKLGAVSRIGDWKFLREGDSTEFVPKSKYYSIMDKSTDDVIAIEKMGGTSRNPTVAYYQVLKRAKPVEKPDVKSIFGGKNDPKEVNAAYDNIRNVVPFLKVLASPELEMSGIVLRNDGSHYHIKMEYRPTKTSSMGQTGADPNFKNEMLEKFIFIQEYQKGFGEGNENFAHITSDGDFGRNDDFGFYSKKRVDQLYAGGLHWTEYKRADDFYAVYHAELHGVIYEMSSQGCTVEEMRKLIETFMQAPKN